LQQSVIDAVAPDALWSCARHAAHRRRAAPRVEAHRTAM